MELGNENSCKINNKEQWRQIEILSLKLLIPTITMTEVHIQDVMGM